MISLHIVCDRRIDSPIWDLVSGLLYQFHCQGIREAEEPLPSDEQALLAGDEFQEALFPGILQPPQEFEAYFLKRTDAEKAMRALSNHLATYCPQYELLDVQDVDYSESWKKSFEPISLKPFWKIRASWHHPSSSHEKELIIDPGMAFGTGTHETTQSCLELMALVEKEIVAGNTFLDFGCGSGILSVALKKLGAKRVIGIDIDPLSIEASYQNAKANNVECDFDYKVQSGSVFDGVVANILKNTLIEFASFFHTSIKKHGFLILSGLLVDQEKEITNVFISHGFHVKNVIHKNEWVSLLLTKN